jgi:hypothetical protein
MFGKVIQNGFRKIFETNIAEELRTCVQLAAGLRVRKYKLLELMQQVQISDESLNHSWKTYTFLQEAIGNIGLITGNICFEDLTKSILNYFSKHCPAIVEHSLELLAIKVRKFVTLPSLQTQEPK